MSAAWASYVAACLVLCACSSSSSTAAVVRDGGSGATDDSGDRDNSSSGSSGGGGGGESSGSESGSSSGGGIADSDGGDAATNADGAGPGAPSPMLVGYLPDYNGSYADYAKSINFSKMTHVDFAFVDPPQCHGTCTSGSDMTFSLGQSDQDIATFVTAAHAAGVKVIASIGGGGGDQMIIQFYNAGLSTQLVDSLDTWVTAHDLDGVDLDIEDPSNMGANYGTFTSALIAKFHPEGRVVTAAVASYLQQGGGAPDSALKQFDFLNDMWYSSDVDGATGELQFFVQLGIPEDRITLGVPFFGQEGNNEPEYGQILQKYPNAWQSDSTNGISYVGEATMAAETKLGIQYGGIMIWELTGDAPPPHSLLNVIQTNL